MSFYTLKDVYQITKNKSLINSQRSELDRSAVIQPHARQLRVRAYPPIAFCFTTKNLLVGCPRHVRKLTKKQKRLGVRRFYRFGSKRNITDIKVKIKRRNKLKKRKLILRKLP